MGQALSVTRVMADDRCCPDCGNITFDTVCPSCSAKTVPMMDLTKADREIEEANHQHVVVASRPERPQPAPVSLEADDNVNDLLDEGEL